MHAAQPWFTVRVTGRALEVRFDRAHLADRHAEELGERLFDLDRESGPNVLRLDFERVDSVGSAVLGRLLALSRHMERDGGHLMLVNVCPHLARILRWSGLDAALDLRTRPAHSRVPA